MRRHNNQGVEDHLSRFGLFEIVYFREFAFRDFVFSRLYCSRFCISRFFIRDFAFSRLSISRFCFRDFTFRDFAFRDSDTYSSQLDVLKIVGLETFGAGPTFLVVKYFYRFF
jgi:hypothetical protein